MIQLYPLPVESIDEALALDGVGPALAKELMKGINSTKFQKVKFINIDIYVNM
jgi:hypothetical protein